MNMQLSLIYHNMPAVYIKFHSAIAQRLQDNENTDMALTM